MSTTNDLFAEHPAEVVQGEPADDASTLEPRVGPAEATSPAASGNVSSAEQATNDVGTLRGAEWADARTSPARAAGCCGGCGEWTKTVTGFGHCQHLPAWTTMSPRAACHFNPSRWAQISAETKARREAQAKIDRAADDANDKVHGWSDLALEFVKTFAENNRGKQFIAAEIVTASLQTDLPQPNSFEAWGRPLQQAARKKFIKRVGSDENRVPLWEVA